ncbi:MAG: D-alanyl-D-alanine carboxypeptidase family protein [Dethiobacteria bacterium]|jgi:D-alanyl-D-alanine carboxypeptidase (penicillin-binding protein 5/6)
MIVAKIKKIAVSMLVLLLCVPGAFAPGKVLAQDLSPTEISSQAAVLMEFSSGEIIFSKNGAEQLPPASLTKVMTLLLAHEAIKQNKVTWTEEVTVSQNAWETGGSQMFLEIGQRVPFGTMLTGIATISANDACVAIGEHLSGSEAVFVQEMNKKAQEIGLKDTYFQNASGLHHPGHYSSALDMARLARNLIRNFPESLKLHSQLEFTFNDILQYNRNPLLGHFNGADGLKTGHTSQAGHCLIGTASQNGLRFITVVMNAASPAERKRDTETLLNYAFRNYTLHQAFPAGETIATAKVKSGEERSVDLYLEEPLAAAVPFNRQEDLDLQISVSENVVAPVKKGDTLGSVKILLDDKTLDEKALHAGKNIRKANIFSRFFRFSGDLLAGLWRQLMQALRNIF